MGRVGLELGYIRLDLPSHVLRAAPEREHVVAVREARHVPSRARLVLRRGGAEARRVSREAASLPLWGCRAASATGRKRLDGKRAAGGDSRGRVDAGLLCVGQEALGFQAPPL